MKKDKMKVMIKDNLYNEDECVIREYIFENVNKLKENEWGLYLTGKQLADMWLNGELIYFPKTQRGVSLKREDGKLKEVAIFNKNNINEIRKAIVRGEYYPDQLTLNLLKDGTDDIASDDKTLILKGKLCILDGQHRIKALSLIRQSDMILGEENLDNIMFPVKITNYEVEQAQEQFYQFTKGLKINKSRIESFNQKEGINRIVNELNRSGALKGLIDTNNTAITKNNTEHLVTFNTMITAIGDSYGKINDEKTEENVLKFLKDFFQILLNIFPEMRSYEERSLSKEYNIICENFTMYGYIELSQLLYCKRYDPNWRNELESIRKIDFNKYDAEGEFNPIWSDIFKVAANGKPAIINNITTRSKFRSTIKEQFYAALYR